MERWSVQLQCTPAHRQGCTVPLVPRPDCCLLHIAVPLRRPLTATTALPVRLRSPNASGAGAGPALGQQKAQAPGQRPPQARLQLGAAALITRAGRQQQQLGGATPQVWRYTAVCRKRPFHAVPCNQPVITRTWGWGACLAVSSPAGGRAPRRAMHCAACCDATNALPCSARSSGAWRRSGRRSGWGGGRGAAAAAAGRPSSRGPAPRRVRRWGCAHVRILQCSQVGPPRGVAPH